MYEAFHSGDLESARAYFDPDVVVDVRGRADIGVGRGPDFLVQTIASWVEAFDDWREEIEDVREVEGRVLVVAVQHGRGKDTGIAVTQRYGIVYEVEGGAILGLTMYPRPEDAADALGLSS
jgi:ketosteroid isomerase-like protein